MDVDVLVTQGADRLTTTVYRKATHIDQYIHFTSNHHNRASGESSKMLEVKSVKDM